MSYIKKIIHNTLNRKGYRIVSVSHPLPIFNSLNDALHSEDVGYPCAFNAPIEKCLTLQGFGFAKNSWHPFVEACENIENIDYANSSLRTFYEKWQPRDAYEALIEVNAPESFKSLLPITLHAPYMKQSPSNRLEFMKNNISDENRWSGNLDLGYEGGYGLQGPVCLEKGKLEYSRMSELTASIKSNGYNRAANSGEITSILIKDKTDYRLIIQHGQHRTAVLGGLGYESVPTRILEIFELQYLDHWPQVYKGNWKINEAADYARHLFEFNPRLWYENL